MLDISWKEVINNLVADLIWTIVLSIIALGFWRTFFGKTRYLYRLFGRDSLRKKKLVLVLPEIATAVPLLPTALKYIAYEDTLGFSFIFSFIQLAKVNYQVRLRESTDDEKAHNLFCIGGPGPNQETKDFIESVQTKFQLKPLPLGGWEIINTLDSKSYRDGPKFDYGLIFKYKNPWGQGSSILICAGIGRHATLGACYYFFENYKMLAKQYKNHNFELLFEVNKNIGYPSTKLIDSYT